MDSRQQHRTPPTRAAHYFFVALVAVHLPCAPPVYLTAPAILVEDLIVPV
jgi:hypothetical protein